MSGFSENTECPNCKKLCDLYYDRKPFDYYTHTCLNCGLRIIPIIHYFTLKELNIERKCNGLRKLKKLPKQKNI